MMTEKHKAFERDLSNTTVFTMKYRQVFTSGRVNGRAEPSRHRAEPSRPEPSRAVPWKTDVDFCAQAAEIVLVAFATLTRFARF